MSAGFSELRNLNIQDSYFIVGSSVSPTTRHIALKVQAVLEHILGTPGPMVELLYGSGALGVIGFADD